MDPLVQRWILAGCAVVLLWIGVALGRVMQRFQMRQKGRRANARGERGERDAEKLLRSLGYRVRARHVPATYTLEVDDAPREVQVVADLIVERAGVRTVAEVKTGRQAPNIGYAETRRQLLEYQLAFAVSGVLLVDVEAGRVREIRFPLAPHHNASSRPLTMLVVAAIVLGCVVFALLRQPV